MLGRIYLPNSISKFTTYLGTPIISKESNKLTEYTIYTPEGDYNVISELFNSLKNATNANTVELIRLKETNVSSLSTYLKDELPNANTLNLSGNSSTNPDNILEDLKGIEKFTGLKKLKLNYTFANLNISAIKNCPTLEEVTLGYCNINSLNGIEGLINLKSLTVNNNNISALKPLENLKNLTSLNLENNAIADTASYVDTEGSIKTYRNLDILANLNSKRNGKLTTLKLAGNNNIIDYSPVSSLSWSAKSGF